MRLRILLAAFVFLGTLTAVEGHHRPPPATPVATVAAAYTGPASDYHAELVRAITAAQNDQLARWYKEAGRQLDEKAATAAQQARTAHPAAKPSGSGPAPVHAGSGDAETAVRAWFGDIFDQAWGVSGCESGHNPGAISPGGGNWGLFQINTVHRADFIQFAGGLLDDQGAAADDPRRTWEGGVLNANLNAAYARKMYNGSGWGPWTCRWAA